MTKKRQQHDETSEPDAPAEEPAVVDAGTEQERAGPDAGAGDPITTAQAVAKPAAEARVEELQDKYLRLAAEFDNFRKRAAREREQAEHHGQGVVIRGLLDAIDDLARFAGLDPWNTEVETVIDGARMVEQKLIKSLAGHGLEAVNPAGHRFDPNLHEAVATAPAASAHEDDLVSEVFQIGYVFNGRLLRPARVVVKQWTA